MGGPDACRALLAEYAIDSEVETGYFAIGQLPSHY